MSTQNLEALAATIDEIEAANPSPEATAQALQASSEQTQAQDAANGWGQLMYTIGGAVCMIDPKLKAVYSEDRCKAWGQAMHAVSEKHGWSTPTNSPEIALVIVSAGFVIPTALSLKSKVQEIKDNKATGTWAQIGLWWRTRKMASAAQKTYTPKVDEKPQTKPNQTKRRD